MTRDEAQRELRALVQGLPEGTIGERTAKAAERLAGHDQADLLRGVLVERALENLVWSAGR